MSHVTFATSMPPRSNRPHILDDEDESTGAAVSLRLTSSKEQPVDVRARITSKGQVTIPKSVRDALDLHEGDELLFRVERSRAVIGKTPEFLGLAGSVPVPAAKRGTPWDAVLRTTRREWAERRS
jgi:antitoxin PrlF